MKALLGSIALVAPLLLAAGAASAQTAPAPAAPPVKVTPIAVTAIKAPAAPKLDGDSSDAVWKSAPVARINAVKGVNFKGGQGATAGTLQAAYDAENLYMLITYDDPTLSVRRSPYVKQADGTWTKLKDPDDKGGDNNKFYEDKLALIWNIGGSIFGFNEKLGCQAACHAGEPGKPYGNKYTNEEGELGDMWHFKYVRGGHLGQIDDQYLDHTRFDEKNKNAGRKTDKKDGGGYEDVKLVDGKPEFMNKDGKPANKGGTYWLPAESKVPFVDNFAVGDEIASIMVAPFTGDRGDVATGAKWANGKWTVEIKRKLVTGSPTDVNFDDLAARYGFGVSFFDNAQVRHAYEVNPLILGFQK